jgi:hypothetical protein
MRVLFADDQLPDADIPDERVFEVMSQRFPDDPDFVRAFQVMRKAYQAVSEDNDVVMANRYSEAIELARTQAFDVAIIDLGWFADPSLREIDRPTAGWKIADALDDADERHPQLPETAKIIYSARFDTEPQLAERAASRGRLPFLKPYQDRFTMPLGSQTAHVDSADAVDAACQTLRATLSFIDHTRRDRMSPANRVNRDLDVLRSAATEGLAHAVDRDNKWDRLTRILLLVAVLIVLAGVVGLFFLGVPQGAVTAAVGIVVGLIPRLMYAELHRARGEIQTATDNLMTLIIRAERLGEESVRGGSPAGTEAQGVPGLAK